MEQAKTVVFLCPHNAAKSVIAAAYWNRLAAERGVDIAADSAGTEPSPTVSTAVVRALQDEGINVADHVPRRATAEELAAAWRVVSMGCAAHELPAGIALERWDDVAATSENLEASRAAIAANVERLLEQTR